VQDFIPTPMSMATAMYYTGIDPLTDEPVYTARGLREKRLQKALLLYWDKEQWPLVREALRPGRAAAARARTESGRRSTPARGTRASVAGVLEPEAAGAEPTRNLNASLACRV
jgi:hypothetical protein